MDNENNIIADLYEVRIRIIKSSKVYRPILVCQECMAQIEGYIAIHAPYLTTESFNVIVKEPCELEKQHK